MFTFQPAAGQQPPQGQQQATQQQPTQGNQPAQTPFAFNIPQTTTAQQQPQTAGAGQGQQPGKSAEQQPQAGQQTSSSFFGAQATDPKKEITKRYKGTNTVFSEILRELEKDKALQAREFQRLGKKLRESYSSFRSLDKVRLIHTHA